jgi:hypothetical protein
MNLKNYTSSISADITISRIERLLVNAGASAIQKHYGPRGECAALMFQIAMQTGLPPITVRLPANVDKCLESLWREYTKSSVRGRKQKEDFIDQAARTAWKLVQDWTEVQVSLIHLNQIETLQAFLPYLWDGKQTYFQYSTERGFKAFLPEKCQ